MSARRVLGALAPLAVLAILLIVEFPLCPSRFLFGVPCPGCGLTRATLAVFTGDLATAVSLHPLMPLITPMVAWMIARMTLVTSGILSPSSYDPLARLPRWFWWCFMVVLVGTWAIRLAYGWLADPVDFAGSPVGVAVRGVWDLF